VSHEFGVELDKPVESVASRQVTDLKILDTQSCHSHEPLYRHTELVERRWNARLIKISIWGSWQYISTVSSRSRQ